MIDYIEEMMMTAGVEKVLIECSDECPNWNKTCSDDMCPAEYPDFTAEKQLEIENFIIKNIGFIRIDYTKGIPKKIQEKYQYNVFGGSFNINSKNYIGKTREQALAQLTTELMKAGELDKEKVRKVLES